MVKMKYVLWVGRFALALSAIAHSTASVFDPTRTLQCLGIALAALALFFSRSSRKIEQDLIGRHALALGLVTAMAGMHPVLVVLAGLLILSVAAIVIGREMRDLQTYKQPYWRIASTWLALAGAATFIQLSPYWVGHDHELIPGITLIAGICYGVAFLSAKGPRERESPPSGSGCGK